MSWWPLTFGGVALLLILIQGRSVRGALFLGSITGMAFYLTHVSWTAEYLGPVPWLALSTLEGALFGIGAAGIAFIGTVIERWWPTAVARLVLVPLAAASVWVGRETFSGSWPYGGFAWGRLAYSQAESPWGPLVAWVGVSGLSFIMVAVTAFLIALIRSRPPVTGVMSSAIVAATLGLVLVAIPAWEPVSAGEIRIAAVQGAGPAGYFDARGPGELFSAQLRATAPILDENADLILWPENSMDEDPLKNSNTARQLTTLATDAGAPVILGAITERASALYNSSIVWTSAGPTQIYDKAHPVPFGEYVPDRAFWSLLAPDLIGLVQRDYTPGTRSPAIDVAGITAGISICFDIVDDALINEMLDDDAQIILAQTNNADFGRTDESAQQLAITRIRAMQTGRAVVTVSTVGQTQIILPNGETSSSIPAFTPGALTETVPLVTQTTPATQFRGLIGGSMTLPALAPLLAAITLSFSKRQSSLRAEPTKIAS